MVFAGSAIASGAGTGVVTATGMSQEIGKIQSDIQVGRRPAWSNAVHVIGVGRGALPGFCASAHATRCRACHHVVPQAASEQEEDTPLKQKLDEFGNQLANVRRGSAPLLGGPRAWWLPLAASRPCMARGGRARAAAWLLTPLARLRPDILNTPSTATISNPCQVIFVICVVVWAINYHHFVKLAWRPGSFLPDWSASTFNVAKCTYYFKIAVRIL